MSPESFSHEQIIEMLRTAEARLSKGASIDEVCVELGIPIDSADGKSSSAEQDIIEQAAARLAEIEPSGSVLVLFRKKRLSNTSKALRVYTNLTRAQSDLVLVKSVSDDIFWLEETPLVT